MQAESAAAVVAQRPHIATAEFVSLNTIANGGGQFGARIGDFDPVDARRLIKPFEMLVETKDRRPIDRLVATHSFKDAAAVVQGMRRNMCIGFLPRDDV